MLAEEKAAHSPGPPPPTACHSGGLRPEAGWGWAISSLWSRAEVRLRPHSVLTPSPNGKADTAAPTCVRTPGPVTLSPLRMSPATVLLLMLENVLRLQECALLVCGTDCKAQRVNTPGQPPAAQGG